MKTSSSYLAMMKSGMESNFIVILGNDPLANKKARIRQVRSHITKEYFRKQEDEKKQRLRKRQNQILIRPASSPIKEVVDQASDSELSISPEVQTPIPFTCNPLLDADSLDGLASRRVQQFFESHLHTNTKRHPLISTVLCWAACTPHFLSAKILQGCAWDDVRDTGVLSEWAIRQRHITTRLLDEAFTSGATTDSRVTVCTIQMLLGFELLRGKDENFFRLRDFCYSFINQADQSNNIAWNNLFVGFSLLEQANLLRIVGNNKLAGLFSPANRFLQLKSTGKLPCPMDPFIFTFGQFASGDDYHLVYLLLWSLYNLVSIAINSRLKQVSLATYEYVVSQRKQVMATSLCIGDGWNEPAMDLDNVDLNIEPLQLSIFIIASCLLNGGEGERRRSLIAQASRLRSLCTKIEANPEHHRTGLKLFPGALVWLYAIGVRFSDPGRDQKWFLLQFLRTTHAWMANASVETEKSSRIIVDCLVHIQKLCVIR